MDAVRLPSDALVACAPSSHCRAAAAARYVKTLVSLLTMLHKTPSHACKGRIEVLQQPGAGSLTAPCQQGGTCARRCCGMCALARCTGLFCMHPMAAPSSCQTSQISSVLIHGRRPYMQAQHPDPWGMKILCLDPV